MIRIEAYQQLLSEVFEHHYSEVSDVWTQDPQNANIAQLLLHVLSGRQSCSILDIGAGRGRDTALFLAEGYRVAALDLVAPPEWEALRQQYGERATFVQQPFMDWIPDQRYSAVLDSGCFHHQHPEEYAAYLQRVFDILEPGGLMLLCVYAVQAASGELIVMPDGRYARTFSETELDALLSPIGFCSDHYWRLDRPERRGYLAALYHKPFGSDANTRG